MAFVLVLFKNYILFKNIHTTLNCLKFHLLPKALRLITCKTRSILKPPTNPVGWELVNWNVPMIDNFSPVKQCLEHFCSRISDKMKGWYSAQVSPPVKPESKSHTVKSAVVPAYMDNPLNLYLLDSPLKPGGWLIQVSVFSAQDKRTPIIFLLAFITFWNGFCCSQ